jgi:Na+/H+-dicarboxylate symporter
MGRSFLMKNFTLTTKIFIGLVLGCLTGIALHAAPANDFVGPYLSDGIFLFLGQFFLRSIQLLMVPLVLITLAHGAAGMQDLSRFGRVGIRTVSFYLLTTAVAIALALLVASLTQPGAGLSATELNAGTVTLKEKQPLIEVLLNIIPTNPFDAIANGRMLQVIVIALVVGCAIAALGSRAQRMRDLLEEANMIIMKIVDFVMWLAPVGVFALNARTFAGMGTDAMLPLAKYMLTVLAVLLIHLLVTYGGLLAILAKMNPLTFMRRFSPVLSVAFSTASSNATLPATLDAVERRLGVPNWLASFTIPLGATINMDGTAIMQGVASVFVAQVYGIELTLAQMLTIMTTATLASIGTAGVPGVGLIMLSTVFASVGLPLEGIALIIGIDRLLDMCRTAVNVTGDAVCSCVVAQVEGVLGQPEEHSKALPA